MSRMSVNLSPEMEALMKQAQPVAEVSYFDLDTVKP